MEKEKLHGCRLDLDSPRLPSARRSASSADTNINRVDSTRAASSSKLSMMVPFSWESSPGVSKLSRKDLFSDKELEPLPPKPPPCLLYANKRENVEHHDRDLSEGSSNCDDAFSDVFDRVSLTVTEQLGIAGRLSSFRGIGFNDLEEIRKPPPGFIMDRFLPAANAIASSSVQKPKPKRRAQAIHREPSIREPNNSKPGRMASPLVQNIEIQKEMASTACGLMVFFPWKLKPIVCGFNNPTNKIKTPRTILSPFSPRRSHKEACNSKFCTERAINRETFIDTSRLASRKTLNNLLQGDDESKNESNGEKESLPQLKPPTESWLSRALGSTINRN